MSNNVAFAARPASTGCFRIPAIDQAVPSRFSKDLQRSQVLARFAKASQSAGVPLPTGDFLNVDQVVAAQWNQFLTRKYPTGIFDGLAGEPVIGISDDSLQVVINAESNLNAYQLKPVVERLEAEATGLGWFIESVLGKATCHGHQVYDMAMATYMLECFHYNMAEFSDQGYARALLLETMDEPLPKKGPIPQETIDRLKQDYSFWPSDLLAEVGGHAHLLGYFETPRSSKPYVMSSREAKQWLQANPQHTLACAVSTAIELKRALARDSKRDFVWNGSDDETETMGALCFLVWDVPDLLFEAIHHFEENQYNGGQAVEAFARNTLDLTEATDADLKRLAASTVHYMNRWALLGKLLSHFPVWEDDDET